MSVAFIIGLAKGVVLYGIRQFINHSKLFKRESLSAKYVILYCKLRWCESSGPAKYVAIKIIHMY